MANAALYYNNSETNIIGKRLSIGMYADGFSFVIRADNEDVVELGHYLTARKFDVFMSLVEEKKWNLSTLDIQLINYGACYTMIPSEVFLITKKNEYLQQVCTDKKVYADSAYIKNEKQSLYTVFGIDEECKKIIDKLQIKNIRHIQTRLLEEVIENRDYCLLNIQNTSFDIQIYKNQKLVLTNHYRFDNVEDFIYFILFSWKQADVDPEKTSLFMCGLINQDAPTYKIIYKYIRNIRWLTNTKTQDVELDEDIPLHYFYTL